MIQYSVEIRDVVKRHGATLAVDRCSFTVKRGEFFSLLGPSGSGKTSLLRLLAGFEQPDQGDVFIEGRSMRAVPPNERPVNLVFQHYALFPHLTVFRNVAFGLEVRHVGRDEVARRVHGALEMVQLSDKAARVPSELSGGEQQRVALARALVNRPAVVLLDEPLGALDQQLRHDMQVELKRIQERVGSTFLYVTHNQEEALTMSDRVAVMHAGRILQIGAPREVYDSPRSQFVSRFIGKSNRLVGRVQETGAMVCRIAVPGLPLLRARCTAALPCGTEVVLSIRPERLQLLNERDQVVENSLPGRIDRVLFNGSETQYWVRVGETESWLVEVPNARSDQKPFMAGESVSIGWNTMDAVVLTE